MQITDTATFFLNGSWVNAGEAAATFYLHTMPPSHGVFEGIRSYATGSGVHLFRGREHYERLLRSTKAMHMDLNYSVSELMVLTEQLLERNGLTDAYIRPVVFMDPSPVLSQEPSLMLTAWYWAPSEINHHRNIMTSRYRRPDPTSSPGNAKVPSHYAYAFMATGEARQKKFDDALMLDQDGYVAQGAMANFFFEKDDTLYTAPSGQILDGITRKSVLKLAREIGFKVEETRFRPEDVWDADGAFFTSTSLEIAGIASLDGHGFQKEWEDSMGFDLLLRYQQAAREVETPMGLI